MNRKLLDLITPRDSSLRIFWPLQTDFLDYSGYGNHLNTIFTNDFLGRERQRYNTLNKAYGRVGMDINTQAEADNLEKGIYRDVLYGTNLTTEDYNQPFSISLWFLAKEESNSVPSPKLFFPFDIEGYVWLQIGDEYSLFTLEDGSGNILQYDLGYFNSYTWYHVTFTYDGGFYGDSVTVYVNGKKFKPHITYVTGDLHIYSYHRTIHLGASSALSGTTPGYVAFFRYYNRVISPQEVSEIYFQESNFYKWETRKGPTIYQINNNADLYIHNVGSESSGVPLYLHSIGQSNGSLNLSLIGAQPDSTNDNISLFMNCIGTGSGAFNSIPLFINGSGGVNGSLNLSIANDGVDYSSGSLNLSIAGEYYRQSSSITLYLENSGIYGSIPLFIKGSGLNAGSVPNSSWMNLFIERNEAAMIPLYIQAPEISVSGEVPLYVFGAYTASSGVDMWISGVGTNNKTLNLYTHGF